MVSLVLNGSDSVRVTPQTRDRVERALRATGYTVDIMGRRLRGKRNQILGVFTYESVFPSGTADFYGPFLAGIEEEAEALGFDLLLFTSPGRRQGRRSVYESGVNRLGLADGCVLLGRHTDREELARLLKERFPFVFIGRRESPAGLVSYVGADYATATGTLYERLWHQGHRRIALVGLADESEASVDRRSGFLAAARRHRKRPPVITDADPRVVFDLIAGQRMTGLLVETTAMADALRAVAMDRGLRIPADLSMGVLGDTDPTQQGLRPVPRSDTLWSMFHIPRRDMGARAVTMLVDKLRGDPSHPERTQILLPCDVVDGTTIGPPRS